jgi:RimJ/RimL family protein N-acetyltransferase
MNRLQKLSAVVARGGMGALARAVRDYGRTRDYSVYRRDVRAMGPESSGICDVRAGSLAELHRWRRTQSAVATPFFADRTGGWREFCWAWSENQPIGVIWTTTKSPLLLTAEDEAVIVDLYTVPSFRGRGVASALIMGACQQLKGHGFRTAYATVELENLPSRRAFERSGFSSVGEFAWGGWLRRRQPTARWPGRAAR